MRKDELMLRTGLMFGSEFFVDTQLPGPNALKYTAVRVLPALAAPARDARGPVCVVSVGFRTLEIVLQDTTFAYLPQNTRGADAERWRFLSAVASFVTEVSMDAPNHKASPMGPL